MSRDRRDVLAVDKQRLHLNADKIEQNILLNLIYLNLSDREVYKVRNRLRLWIYYKYKNATYF